jgi:hypothetical protein
MTDYLRTTDAGSGNSYLRTTAGAPSAVPAFSSGPTVSDLSNTTFTVKAALNKVAYLSVVLTNQAASQPSDSTFDSSSFKSGFLPSGTLGGIYYSGATSGTAYKVWVQAIDSDGNRTTSSVNITTVSTTPTITGISNSNPELGSSLTITGTSFAASGNIVTLDGIAQTVTSESSTSVTITVNGRFGSVLTLLLTEPVSSLSSSYLVTSVVPPSGWQFINVTTPDTIATKRITATPDIVSGDQIAWGNITGTGTVTINSDATFTNSSTVSGFDVRVWTPAFGYGAAATQALDIISPTGYSVAIDQADINASNQISISFTISSAEVGSTYNYTLTSSTGGTPVIGSGAVTSTSQQITGINVSALTDGTVTLSLTLTDTSGNTGAPASSARIKNTVATGTPNPFTFTSPPPVAINTVVTSNIVTIAGISGPVSVQITNGEYSISGGAWSSSNTTLVNGSTLQVRRVSSGSFSTTTTTTITVGTYSTTFSVPTVAADTTPDAFSFTPVPSAALNTPVTSNSITVTGINTTSPISVTNAQYSIDGGAFTSTTGDVVSGNIITLRLTTPATQGTQIVATLTIGGVSGTWSVTTVAPSTVSVAVTLWDVIDGANTLVLNTPFDWFLMSGFGTGILGAGQTSTNSTGVLVIPPVVGSVGNGWLALKRANNPNYATLIPVVLS